MEKNQESTQNQFHFTAVKSTSSPGKGIHVFSTGTQKNFWKDIKMGGM